jgi:uncharacterized protein
MRTKSILTFAMAAVLLLTISACRDTSKSADQSAQASQSEAVAQQINEDLLPDAPSSPILDMVGLLSEKDVKEITEKIIELDSLKLAQVAVVTVNDLKGMKALDYATALANKWGVGHKETNDGITIVVKPKTGDAKGEAAIATGLGTEKKFPDQMCTDVIDMIMVPKFKENKYGEGIEDALDKIKDILLVED